MSIEIRGLEECLGRLEEITDTRKVQDTLGFACNLVERSAKQNAPKGNGELARSITSRLEGLEGIIYTPLFYAPYVEYGTGKFAENGGREDVPWVYQDIKGDWHTTSGMEPRPYMRPALNENRERILKLMRERLLDG